MEQRGIESGSLTHWCDNEAAVSNTENPPDNPGALIRSDADLVLAIKTIKETM